jgi:hypothetical protein
MLQPPLDLMSRYVSWEKIRFDFFELTLMFLGCQAQRSEKYRTHHTS